MKRMNALICSLLIAAMVSTSVTPVHAKEGWNEQNGTWTYVKDGSLAKGWMKEGNCWYFFDDEGNMAANKWLASAEHWYWFGGSGVMQQNTLVEDAYGNKYFLKGNGIMARNYVKGGLEFGDDGVGRSLSESKSVVINSIEDLADLETVEGNLYIGEDIVDDLILEDINVKGKLVLLTDLNVTLKDVNINTVYIQSNDAKVSFEGETTVNEVILERGATITADKKFDGVVDSIKIQSSVTESVVIDVEAKDVTVRTYSEVKINQSVEKVTVLTETDLVVNADVEEIVIESSANDSIINIDEDCTVGNIKANAPVDIKGEGTVENIEANVDGVTADKETTIKDVDAANGVTDVPKADKPVTGGGSSGGNGGGSTDPIDPKPEVKEVVVTTEEELLVAFEKLSANKTESVVIAGNIDLYHNIYVPKGVKLRILNDFTLTAKGIEIENDGTIENKGSLILEDIVTTPVQKTRTLALNEETVSMAYLINNSDLYNNGTLQFNSLENIARGKNSNIYFFFNTKVIVNDKDLIGPEGILTCRKGKNANEPYGLLTLNGSGSLMIIVNSECDVDIHSLQTDQYEMESKAFSLILSFFGCNVHVDKEVFESIGKKINMNVSMPSNLYVTKNDGTEELFYGDSQDALLQYVNNGEPVRNARLLVHNTFNNKDNSEREINIYGEHVLNGQLIDGDLYVRQTSDGPAKHNTSLYIDEDALKDKKVILINNKHQNIVAMNGNKYIHTTETEWQKASNEVTSIKFVEYPYEERLATINLGSFGGNAEIVWEIDGVEVHRGSETEFKLPKGSAGKDLVVKCGDVKTEPVKIITLESAVNDVQTARNETELLLLWLSNLKSQVNKEIKLSNVPAWLNVGGTTTVNGKIIVPEKTTVSAGWATLNVNKISNIVDEKGVTPEFSLFNGKLNLKDSEKETFVETHLDSASISNGSLIFNPYNGAVKNTVINLSNPTELSHYFTTAELLETENVLLEIKDDRLAEDIRIGFKYNDETKQNVGQDVYLTNHANGNFIKTDFADADSEQVISALTFKGDLVLNRIIAPVYEAEGFSTLTLGKDFTKAELESANFVLTKDEYEAGTVFYYDGNNWTDINPANKEVTANNEADLVKYIDAGYKTITVDGSLALNETGLTIAEGTTVNFTEGSTLSLAKDVTLFVEGTIENFENVSFYFSNENWKLNSKVILQDAGRINAEGKYSIHCDSEEFGEAVINVINPEGTFGIDGYDCNLVINNKSKIMQIDVMGKSKMTYNSEIIYSRNSNDEPVFCANDDLSFVRLFVNDTINSYNVRNVQYLKEPKNLTSLNGFDTNPLIQFGFDVAEASTKYTNFYNAEGTEPVRPVTGDEFQFDRTNWKWLFVENVSQK